MSEPNYVKLLVIGPTKSGKTAISNYLAEFQETPSPDYRATAGCRVLEFEREIPSTKDKRGVLKVNVELWDCAGDRKYESCWSAMARDANGLVFVFNPDMKGHEKEVELWYKWFGELKPQQCVSFAHASQPQLRAGGAGKNVEGNKLAGKIPHKQTSLDQDPQLIRQEFDQYLTRLITFMITARDKEEAEILKT
eukprot:CAMPEP_0184644640 /NCGR_PEP_ID=MMETSP0308-20130426/1336_1 /TAXON_ID=38269 /ORGANISM="Gloeochaete witrockiana, Strain SAG 46.84" /LENGTH=193 /DNA_ID=CAMNT_0027073295 /DNA_START=65 /DNA_END=646 /DNA_ORIENTATION=+